MDESRVFDRLKSLGYKEWEWREEVIEYVKKHLYEEDRKEEERRIENEKEEEEERKKEKRIEMITEKARNFNSEIKQYEKNGPFDTIHFHKHVKINEDEIPIDLRDNEEEYEGREVVDLSIDDKYEILQLVKKYKPNKITVHFHKKLYDGWPRG